MLPTPAQDTFKIDPHKWVMLHSDYLYAYAAARLNDSEQARELVQETFLAALEKINSFKGRSSECTWLTAILKHKLIDIYRKNSSKAVSPKEDQFFETANGHWNAAMLPEAGFEASDPMVNKELARTLDHCMQKLPPLWLHVFTMKHVDDTDTREICTNLKLTAPNFWVIMHRAKLHLRACLQNHWIND